MNNARTLVCLGNRRGSLLRPLAVRDFLNDITHDVDKIIFSGGRTRGPSHTSEAGQMNAYFRTIWRPTPSLENHEIILEEESFDTEQNAIRVKDILKATNLRIYLITSELKLSRAVDIFERHGFDVIGLAAEKIITENRTLSKKEIRNQKRKEELVYEHVLEPIARVAMRIQIVREIVSSLTQKRVR